MKQPFISEADHLQMMSRMLALTPEQKDKAEPLMDKTRARIKAIQEESAERIQAVIREAHTQFEPMLNDEQKKKLQALPEHMKAPNQRPASGEEAPRQKSPPESRPHQRPASGHEPPHEPDHMAERVFSELGLTPDQKEKMRGFMVESHGRMKKLRENGKISPEEKEVMNKRLREDLEAKVRPLLNPEQLKRLDELKARLEASERKKGPGGRPHTEDREAPSKDSEAHPADKPSEEPL